MAEERLILGIETSCDETAASVVRGRAILSSVIASQHELHAEYQGVVPEIASRAHAERILPIVRGALAQAGVGMADIGAVAVGNRPGLIGSLLVGVSAAKALAWSLGVPLVGVEHVQAHLFAGLMHQAGQPATPPPAWPALGLVVSGGHTALYLAHGPERLERLGGTIDDALGEAYDKVAALLGLAFPGGPRVDQLAQTGNAKAFTLPVSRLRPDSLDFSFSGLKTAVRYLVQGVPGAEEPVPTLDDTRRADVCASFQHAAIAAVELKLTRALERAPGVGTVIVGGGVSANSLLRQRLTTLTQRRGLGLRLPAMGLCLDNAAMIAGLGHEILARRGWASDPLDLTAHPTASPA